MTLNLKALRKHFNLTQLDLSEILELQQGVVSRMENGKYGLKAELVQKLKERLGDDVEQFYVDEEDIVIEPESEAPTATENQLSTSLYINKELVEELRKQNERIDRLIDYIIKSNPLHL